MLPASALASTEVCPHTWNTTLTRGSRGADVSALQQFLNVTPTGYFGSVTRSAVMAFQTQHGFEAIGSLGPKTRAALNTSCAVSASAPTGRVLGISTSTEAVTTDTLTIGTAPQPAATLAPASALYVPFTSFTLTAGDADVNVTKLVAERVGLAVDQAFDYVSLLDADGNEVTYGYLRADHTVTFRDTFTVPAHETQTFTISGNMKLDLSSYDGQMAGFRVTTIDASAPVSGTLPGIGTLQRINTTITIGEGMLQRSPLDPTQATTRTFSNTPVTFSAVRLTAGSEEDMRLYSVRFRMSGTAASSDIQNPTITVGDTTIPAHIDERDFSADFPGILIPKGQSVDISIRGALNPGAANRSVQFDIQYSTDIYLRGTTYGYGIAPYPSDNTDVAGATSAFLTTDGTTDGDALTPFYAGSPTNVTSGTAVYIGN